MNVIASHVEHCTSLVVWVVSVMGVGVRVQGRGEGEGALRRHFQRHSSGRGRWDDEVILDHLHSQVIHLAGQAGGDLGQDLLWTAKRPATMATDHTYHTHTHTHTHTHD